MYCRAIAHSTISKKKIDFQLAPCSVKSLIYPFCLVSVMIPDLKEIRQLRKSLGLSQVELAEIAKVSQSLIAKIESGRIDPAYGNAVKIFAALFECQEKSALDIRKMIQKRLICVPPGTLISKAVAKMKRHGISQLPVCVNGQAVGLVSESSILDALIEHKGTFVRDIMQEPPPIIPLSTNAKMVSSLLRYYPIVLFSEKGKILGLVTKSDLLASL
jgi:predicted transcriptional regulator